MAEFDSTIEGIKTLINRNPEREQWCIDLMWALAPWFERAGSPIDPKRVRIGVGYTSSGRRRKGASIGECLYPQNEKQFFEVTVRLDQTGDDNVSETLVHELCHVALPQGVGHNAPFKRLAAKFGLDMPPKMNAICKGITVETEKFQKWIREVREEAGLGPYPAAGQFSYEPEEQKKKKKAPTTIKLTCEACESIAWQKIEMYQEKPVCCGNQGCSQWGQVLEPKV